MIKIYNDAIGLSNFPSDISNGVGKINDNNDLLTEELNGIYEGEFELLQSDPHYTDLHVGSYIEIPTVNGSQIFKVYYISKAINGVSTVRYCHVTYDLSKTVVSPFTATGAVNTKNGMLSHVMGNTPFTMTTDITNTTSNFSLDIPRSFRECLGGYEGSILDVFRPEYEWDNLTVKMLAHRGSDNGVRIAYGKNLTDFKQEENIENVYTSVLGYAVVDDVTYLGTIYDKIVTSYPKVKIVDFSSDYESGEVPTQAELTTKAQTYAENNDIEIPNVNLTISFVPLYQTEEYKNIAPLERVQLGDTVHVFFEKLGVEASARVIKTVWNVNLQRYDSIELGNAKANLNTVINDSVDNAVNNALSDLDLDTGAIESEMLSMSKLIANSMGLHITKDSIGRIFLHNDETLANSQYQYQITAGGFMLSEDYGQTWNSGWDISGNVVVNSLATITLKFLEGYGMFMRFGDVNSNYIDVSPYSEGGVSQGVSFVGSGSIRMQPQGTFHVMNMAGDNTNYFNRLVMSQSTASGSPMHNMTALYNYDDGHNYILANTLELDAHYTSGSSTYNRALLRNYATLSGTQYSANYLSMYAYTDRNTANLYNNKFGSSNTANLVQLTADGTTHSASIYNYQKDYTYQANLIQLTGGSSNDAIRFYNYRLGQSSVEANSMALNCSSTSNQVNLVNRKLSDTNYANAMSLYGYSDMNWTEISNYQLRNNYYASRIQFNADANQQYARLYNYVIEANNTPANEIELLTNSSGNKLSIWNFNNSGITKNYITMDSGNSTMEIYSSSDIFLNSGGAIRMQSFNSQDITMTSSDDINLAWGDKLYLNNKQVYLSGGYVRYYE